ncbi:MAG: hypothetical protein PHI06_09725 [Desulfobulbaceae bacterium]|nr:hypothetical protein [Desulfobulbaceae bacterium]
MLNPKERWALFYGQQLNPFPEGLKTPDMPMAEILPLLHTRQQNGHSVKLINNETAAVRITDMTIDTKEKIACLLIQYADKTISDPVFSNLENGALRVEPKLDGEGVAVSAHMLISLTPNKDNPREYLTLLEDIPGFTRSMIEHFLTSEFRQVSDFEFVDDNKKTRRCRPIVALEGHTSQTLQDGLKKGFIQGVELVRYGKKSDFDESDYTTEVSYNVNIKCVRTGGDGAVGLINRLFGKAKEQKYTEMKVRYKRPEGRQQTISIPTGREGAIDTLFTRMEKIKVEDPLPQCSSEINAEVLAKLKGLLIATR